MVHQKGHSKYQIKKSTVEWTGLILLILFSFISSTTLLISLVLMLTLLVQKEIGAIKILNIITFRTVINPGIAINIGNWQTVKWLILFGCSIYLLLSYFKLEKRELSKVKPISILLVVFVAYNIFVALTFSSLPVIAIFKLMSYAIVSLGILIGVGYTYKKIDWSKWMFQLLALLLLSSLAFIPLSVGYLKNGSSFQGITNQPNMFGIIAVLFTASLLTYARCNKKYNSLYIILLPTLIIYMIILSKSRTAFISFIILILLFIAFSNIKKLSSLIKITFSAIAVILFVLVSNLSERVSSFLYKGQDQGNLLYSRINQIDDLKINFLSSPLFGNGFSVPVLPFKSYEFNFDFVVELGNLIIAVLYYSGIVGFIIFISYIVRVFWSNKEGFKDLVLLPVAAILISMGEMVFFSSNNIGIWCYMFLAMYVFLEGSSRRLN